MNNHLGEKEIGDEERVSTLAILISTLDSGKAQVVFLQMIMDQLLELAFVRSGCNSEVIFDQEEIKRHAERTLPISRSVHHGINLGYGGMSPLRKSVVIGSCSR